MDTFYTPENWMNGPLAICVIGAGSTGSEVLDGLARMSMALSAIGGDQFDITIYDDDEVSVSNVGRQRFAPADVGHNKAVVLAHRYNLAFGLSIKAKPERFVPTAKSDAFDLYVTCTDSAQFRIDFGKWFDHCQYFRGTKGWLDFGNGSHTGQVVFGVSQDRMKLLPNVVDLYPELDEVDDTEEPSCSLEDALMKQDFGINRFLADAGLSLVWQLMRYGSITQHGAFIDQRKCQMQPLKISPEAWAFMGYEPKDETN